MKTFIAISLLIGSSVSFAQTYECYRYKENSRLKVCISSLSESAGTGYSVLESTSAKTLYNWVRTTKNILMTEISERTRQPTGCESGLEIQYNTMKILNLDKSCGIPSGDYIKE